ncbi:MAG TPA: FAD-dependent oxidoreductase, partial [Bdellovibrionota bacterium]|nr:FAD-dependent oxidoreductase [Bdellovibrionota bacterium]
LWFNTSVAGYDGHTVRTGTGKRLDARTVIWTAGVKGSVLPGLDPAWVERNRLKVDAYSKVVGSDSIYAIGDVADMRTEAHPQGLPMMAPPAMQQGRQLARNLIRAAAGRELEPFRYRDKGSMATIGRGRAVAVVGQMRFKGFAAWVIWLAVHLLYLMGFRNRLLVFVNWVWNYLSYDRGNRLIVRPSLRRQRARAARP